MAKTLQAFVEEALETVPEIDADHAETRLGEFMVLDVREPEEYAEGHVPGAINIPRGTLEVAADHEHEKRDDRLYDRRRRILCVCGGGFRSVLAAKTLQEMGFQETLSLKGGFTGWTEAGKRTER